MNVTPGSPPSTPIAVPLPGRRSTLLSLLWRRFKDLLKWPFYVVYQSRLQSQLASWRLPRHIGLIMDGNRRFARAAGFASIHDGHNRGAEKLWDVLSWCYEAGVSVVTVWSFSIDNFHRDTREVEALLRLFEDKTRELANHSEVHEKQVRVRYIGKLELLPESLRHAIEVAERATAHYERFQLNIAMAYGGRQEIASAFRQFLQDRAQAGQSLEQVAAGFEERSIEPYLYTFGQPEPDLILRTSGEVRLSGFLLWQSAYSEFYFCDTHWPALRRIDLLRALRSYHLRERRLGR